VLNESDITVARVVTRGALAPDRATLVGWVTRRPLRAGEPLRAPAVVPPVAVRRGDSVDVVVTNGPLRLTARGVALADAGRGDSLAVRLGPKRVVQAAVDTGGQLTLINVPRVP
jgi:flagella basal body P-ring formation protein FlgA